MKYKIYWWQAPKELGWNNSNPYGIEWINVPDDTGFLQPVRRYAIVTEEEALILKLKYPRMALYEV